MNTRKAGIYISIPFCRQKCTYCNFASDIHPSVLLPSYVDALIAEITGRTAVWEKAGIPSANISADTIYMGGGTPGLLTSGQLARLLDAVGKSFSLGEVTAPSRSPFDFAHGSTFAHRPERSRMDGPETVEGRLGSDVEITIEASPENVTQANAAAWAASGINRVSLGVQSMVHEELRAVGRMHDTETVSEAFANLRAAGIHNISADLIAGLPNQTAGSWERSLQSLTKLDPMHFSIYMLEVDDDSRLGRELLEHGRRYHAAAVPSDEQVAEFYSAAMEFLRAAGFEHYEISNFARPGWQSRHNQKYWTNAPYFGFGVDAHSYDGERRWANADSLAAYLERMEQGRPPIVEQKDLCSREKLEERMFLGLRRREGISLSRLNSEFASSYSVAEKYAEPIREFCEAGWLEAEGDSLRLTDRGILFSNEVFAGFLGEV